MTLANWRTAPFNRWAFQHVREIVPSADIPHDPSNVRPLPIATMNIDGLRIPDAEGPALTLDEFLQRASTDALVVLHDGRIVIERYANGMGPRTPHILMSVSKSLLGLLTGVLVDQGKIDPDELVTALVPEVAGTAYEGANVRHLLDMRSGRRVRRRLHGDLRPDRRIPEIDKLEPARPRRVAFGPALLLPIAPRFGWPPRRSLSLHLAQYATCWAGSSSGRPASGSPT